MSPSLLVGTTVCKTGHTVGVKTRLQYGAFSGKLVYKFKRIVDKWITYFPDKFNKKIKRNKRVDYSKTYVKRPLKNRQNKDLNDKW